MKILLLFVAGLTRAFSLVSLTITLDLTSSKTIDSLGACQGVSYQQNKVYIYGEREVGVIRELIEKNATADLFDHPKENITHSYIIGHFG